MVYINGTANLSPQISLSGPSFLTDPVAYHARRLFCIEPPYNELIDPVKLRRMSKILRIAWVASKASMDEAGIAHPDAIITGTGMGCFAETERFLISIYENGEKFLPATPFMQSAHSTIGSQIALMSGCSGYNMTYSHRGFSFESALVDAFMLFKENKARHILCGGVDDMTDNQFIFQDRIHRWKKHKLSTLELMGDPSPGTISGEGSAFFMLGNEAGAHTYARIKGLHTFIGGDHPAKIQQSVTSFLQLHQLAPSDMDVLMLGLNGDAPSDALYHELRKSLFKQSSHTYYKHLCGEYPTSTAFALWTVAHILKYQQIPEVCILNKLPDKALKHALIYNHYNHKYHSLILLSS